MTTEPFKPGDLVTIPRVVKDTPLSPIRHERWPAVVTHVGEHAVSVVFENPYKTRREERETLEIRRVHKANP